MTEPALLLDSNVVVWLDQRPQRIPAAVMFRIESAERVFVSAVTAWELAIKQSLGQLTLQRPIADLIEFHALTELPITIRHGEAVRNLPLHHRDPFDRLLLAQALVGNLVLVTADRHLAQYGVPILQL
jgi:PIN domain nuclease of toxin-antitoxin system